MAVAQRQGGQGPDQPTLWFALGVIAVIGCVLAAFRLALYDGLLGIGAAAGAGAVAYYAFDHGYELYQERAKRRPPGPLSKRARELTLAPSLEVYDPRESAARPPDRFGPGR